MFLAKMGLLPLTDEDSRSTHKTFAKISRFVETSELEEKHYSRLLDYVACPDSQANSLDHSAGLGIRLCPP